MRRVVIENVVPEIEEGAYPVKRVAGEKVEVEADVFADGHDVVSAVLGFRHTDDPEGEEVRMKHLGNDRWRGSFTVEKEGLYLYTIRGWVNRYRTWCSETQTKHAAGQDITVELQTGIEMLASIEDATRRDADRLRALLDSVSTNRDAPAALGLLVDEEIQSLMDGYVPDEQVTRYRRELAVWVERGRASFSSWYELFPRSCGDGGGKGTLKQCERLLPSIAEMGFDVVYLPPIHPIGTTNRKGRNNNPVSSPDDPGSPWAIGSSEGGHKQIHPELGTLGDFRSFIRSAERLGIEVAIDLAFQCSPDHPYVREHPQWFRWRPDGTVQFAENPPKKYEDVIPINFETDDRQSLWEELKSVITYWVDQGVRIFRVDNPHTKPFAFWEWVIDEVKRYDPSVIFLAEAFTRPKVMYRLAKIGFTQSYTYFTWRNTKQEITDYLTELTGSPARQYFRPCFWPNTPDILPEYLQYGGRPAFIVRLVLAATLSSNYGIYGPAFELCEGEALQGREEYRDSEKYELKNWNRDREGNIKEVISRVNAIRKDNPALHETNNLRFHHVENDFLLFYQKGSEDGSNLLFIAVNLDPYHTQAGRVYIPLNDIGIEPGRPFLVYDLLSDEKYVWQGEHAYVELNPAVIPAAIFLVKRFLKRENDFDYFM
jgi:starch synthase (maltosyl-transferring)